MIKDRLLANEETSVVAASQMIQQEMYEQLHVLGLLKQSARIKNYVSSGSDVQRHQLELYFPQVSSAFHRVDQISLLDNNGQKLVRVDLKNALLPPVSLAKRISRGQHSWRVQRFTLRL